ncbi:MAG: cobalt and zinc/H(+)-K(+) antiporter [Candidatus Ordinivivax streblomastigis]|uniref:Cobalt and zinc/H(+)-K(+) antiporter n=1 Tax=Candidatus Ordinivivax streblomastigis TaxID=2540710 RepID=A0A5M8NV05_9BACT|nr:MAG: cobalt and zinc/H(+)-K(+) antiporter [Candidatus Ordinivivax streblomastigis]
MAHFHEHHEHHHAPVSSLNKAFTVGISLNILFVLAEFLAGLHFNSLGLLSDAGHNLSDVASFVLAMLAFRLAKLPATERFTYGYKKSTVLVSLLNAVILLLAVGMILYESVEKLLTPQAVDGNAIAWVAGIGVFINGLTAWLFLKDKDKDLNAKGAYLHMLADALVSVGVVVSGIVIQNTGWSVIDPVIGLVIGFVIIYSTWGLLRDSVRLSLDGVPAEKDVKVIEQTIISVDGVENVHHLHIWAISTTETALTAHVILKDMQQMEDIKNAIKHQLFHVGIQHATIEFEHTESHCDAVDCNPLQ